MEYLEASLIRQIDAAAIQELGMPGLLLMENAARGVSDVLQGCNPKGRIVIVCGPGNNGGDGLALARILAANNVHSEIYLVRAGKRLTSDAESNLSFLSRSQVPVFEADAELLQNFLSTLTTDDWIIDALLGTGIRGELQSPFAEIVNAVNKSAAKVLSVDVPSGLNSDTGEPCGVAIEADVTVTFVASKAGFHFEHARPYLGRLFVRHIGIPASWLEEWCLRAISNAS